MVYRTYLKLVFDVILSFLGILIVSPIIVIFTIMLSFANNGKPFFFQKRPGKDERIFSIVKFRTMNNKTDVNGELLPDSARLTKIGKFVRKTSIDELPQLINVLKGDMSLIGPRPLLVEYLSSYNNEQKKRHNVRPGITGWAQVNGRNAISWEDKFKLDVWYVNNISLVLDLKIFLLTVKKVFIREGISAKGSVTMEKFIGSI